MLILAKSPEFFVQIEHKSSNFGNSVPAPFMANVLSRLSNKAEEIWRDSEFGVNVFTFFFEKKFLEDAFIEASSNLDLISCSVRYPRANGIFRSMNGFSSQIFRAKFWFEKMRATRSDQFC